MDKYIRVTHSTPQDTQPAPTDYDFADFREAYPDLALLFPDKAETGTRLRYVGYHSDGEPFQIEAEVTEDVSRSDLGNQNGYRCPGCRSGEDLCIQAVQHIEARLYPDGTDDNGGDIEWQDDDAARCSDCGWNGTVKDLISVNVID